MDDRIRYSDSGPHGAHGHLQAVEHWQVTMLAAHKAESHATRSSAVQLRERVRRSAPTGRHPAPISLPPGFASVRSKIV